MIYEIIVRHEGESYYSQYITSSDYSISNIENLSSTMGLGIVGISLMPIIGYFSSARTSYFCQKKCITILINLKAYTYNCCYIGTFEPFTRKAKNLYITECGKRLVCNNTTTYTTIEGHCTIGTFLCLDYQGKPHINMAGLGWLTTQISDKGIESLYPPLALQMAIEATGIDFTLMNELKEDGILKNSKVGIMLFGKYLFDAVPTSINIMWENHIKEWNITFNPLAQ